jgi:hypothetical protein
MGILSANCWKTTRGVYPSISDVSHRLQIYHATVVNKWVVTIRLFRDAHSAESSRKSTYLIDFDEDSIEDCYIVTCNEEGSISQVRSKKKLEWVLQKQVTSLKLRQTAKIEGMAYRIGSDLHIRVGTLSIGAAVKGYIWFEIEYLPCEDIEACETLLRECFSHFIHPSSLIDVLFFTPSTPDLRLARGNQYIELLRKEGLL